MFIDELKIAVKAGKGGPGKVSFHPGLKAGPDGGNGGRGGDVYIQATSDITALNQFSQNKSLSAEDGHMGENNLRSGKDGLDLVLKLPIGSLITIQPSGEQLEIINIGQKILLCKGGLGGRGNFELRSSRVTTPIHAQKGLPGKAAQLDITLRLIANFGLIGLPNSGKSSLLNELTAARSKIGLYPFTTLEPNLGTIGDKVIADIPGLIEGASEGKGLGVKFLKHIEKVETLLHCISAESEDIDQDYQIIISELANFNPNLAEKNQIILLTKTDLLSSAEVAKKIKHLKKYSKTVLPISIYDWDSINKLKQLL